MSIDPSMIYFSLICLTSTCYGNTFSQYRIWAPKRDSRAIAWVSSCQFPTGPSCILVLFPAVSTTYALLFSPDLSSWIVIAPPVVWVGAAVGWVSGVIVAGALVRVAIAA